MRHRTDLPLETISRGSLETPLNPRAWTCKGLPPNFHGFVIHCLGSNPSCHIDDQHRLAFTLGRETKPRLNCVHLLLRHGFARTRDRYEKLIASITRERPDVGFLEATSFPDPWFR